jgi:hypothetical protein
MIEKLLPPPHIEKKESPQPAVWPPTELDLGMGRGVKAALDTSIGHPYDSNMAKKKKPKKPKKPSKPAY